MSATITPQHRHRTIEVACPCGGTTWVYWLEIPDPPHGPEYQLDDARGAVAERIDGTPYCSHCGVAAPDGDAVMREERKVDEQTVRFSIDDAQRAGDGWKFNCGPAALYAVLGKTPDEIRPHLLNFETISHQRV